jgi:phosphoribosyl 1,2-cyclic phosphodiesterase
MYSSCFAMRESPACEQYAPASAEAAAPGSVSSPAAAASSAVAVRVCVLGSGSSGNSTWVEAGGDAILVDAGLSAQRTRRTLRECGLDERKLRAICVTHEHTDHTCGIARLHALLGIPAYANTGTARAVRNVPSGCWKCFVTGNPFEVGPFKVLPFLLPHDAYEPVGYRIACGGVSVGIATDLGMATTLVRGKLAGCNLLVIEANHDEELVRQAQRPWSLKQRILGNQGHLSNRAAAALLAEIAGDSLRTVVLAHISRDCNREDLAVETVREELASCGLGHVEVLAAHAGSPTPVCVCAGPLA